MVDWAGRHVERSHIFCLGRMNIKPIESGTPMDQNWRTINQTLQELADQARRLKALEAELARIQGGAVAPGLMHPFKIYRLPRIYQDAGDEDAWHTVRVRAGRYLDADVSGTDGYDEDPDEMHYPLDVVPDLVDIVVPLATEKYYFWIELAVDGVPNDPPLIRHGLDPAANGWDGWPTLDADHVLIGWVDTTTFADTHRLRVRQLLRADVLMAGEECDY